MKVKFNTKFTVIISLLFFFLTQPSFSADDPTVKFRKAKKLFERNRFAAAQKLFLEFIKEEPFEYEIRDSLFMLGEIYRKQNDCHNANSYYNRLDKRYPHSRYRVPLLYTKGHCYYETDLYTRSRQHLKKYLASVKDPSVSSKNYTHANILMGVLHEQTRQWRKAAQYYQNAILILDRDISRKPRDKKLHKIKKDVLYSLGMIYASHLGNKELAHEYLAGATELGQNMTPGLSFLLRKMSLTHYTRENGLPDDAISDIQVDGDDVWIATWGGGLVRFSRSTERFEQIKLPSKQLRDLFVDFETVYITSFDGIFVYDKKSNRTKRLTSGKRLFTLAQKVFKDDRTIYFSTLMDGIIEYDTIKRKIKILDHESFLGSRQVYAIEADHRYVAFGTLDNGAVIKNKKTGEVHYLNVENGKLKGNNVKALLIDGRYVWVAVHKHGIYRYDLTRKVVKFFDWGLPYPSCLALRGRKVWVGTSGNGIRIYDRENGHVDKMTVLNGLSSNEIHHLQMEENYIWIGYLDNGLDILYRPQE